MPRHLPSVAIDALRRLLRVTRGSALWPGLEPGQTLLVLHGGGFAYLVGHPAPPAGVVRLGQVAGQRPHAGPPPACRVRRLGAA